MQGRAHVRVEGTYFQAHVTSNLREDRVRSLKFGEKNKFLWVLD